MLIRKKRGLAVAAAAPENKKAKLSGRAKLKLTEGQRDHQDPWHDGDQWRGVSILHGTPDEDDIWFRFSPDRRFRVRRAFPFECYRGPQGNNWWVIVVRSRHDCRWNTVAFRFHDGIQLWPDPHTDDEALKIVGRYDVQAMLAAKLLTISYRYVDNAFWAFDHGARDE